MVDEQKTERKLLLYDKCFTDFEDVLINKTQKLKCWKKGLHNSNQRIFLMKI